MPDGEHRTARAVDQQRRSRAFGGVLPNAAERTAIAPGACDRNRDTCSEHGNCRDQLRSLASWQRDHRRAVRYDSSSQPGAGNRRLDREGERSRRDPQPRELVLAGGAYRQVPLELGRLVRVERVEGEAGCLLVDHA